MSFSTIASETDYLTDSTLVPELLSSSFSSVATTTSTSTSFSSSCSNASNLLFGEIENGETPFSTTTNSHCTIPNTSSSSFLRLWLNQTCRTTILSSLPASSLKCLRLVCHDFSDRTAPFLFTTLSIPFSSHTFSRSSRLPALRRIGQNVKTVRVVFKRDMDTLLQPVIDPWTGEEKPVTWDPRARDVKARFGGEEMLELVGRQYPPLFFTATNVAGFLGVLGCLGLVEEVGIIVYEDTTGYGNATTTTKGSRMDVVDYALLSLRLAVEKSFSPVGLKSLTLRGGLRDLMQFSPVTGLGATPGSMRRWRGIKSLDIVLMDDANGNEEKIRMLHNYLRNFTGLEMLVFAWKGRRGSCPLPMPTAKSKDATLHPALRSNTTPLFAAIFPKLQVLRIANAGLQAPWVNAVLEAHRLTLKELELENVVLNGSWEDALRDSSKNIEVKSQGCVVEEIGDLPIMLGSALAANTGSKKQSTEIDGVRKKVSGIGEGEEEKRKKMQGEVRRMLMTEEEVRMEVQAQGQIKEKKKKGREKGWIHKTCAGVFGWRVRG